MCRVRDIMTTKVVTLTPEASVEEAIDTLVDQRISGAPVVDAEGRLLGVLTEYHLLKIASFPSVQDMTVGELMTKAVWVISEDAHISVAADLLARHRIRRLPVVDHGYVVGVISRRDVIRHLLRQRRELAGMEDLPRICERLMKCIGHERAPRPKKARRTAAASGSTT
jgi:CBS domain-containing protein